MSPVFFSLKFLYWNIIVVHISRGQWKAAWWHGGNLCSRKKHQDFRQVNYTNSLRPYFIAGYCLCRVYCLRNSEGRLMWRLVLEVWNFWDINSLLKGLFCSNRKIRTINLWRKPSFAQKFSQNFFYILWKLLSCIWPFISVKLIIYRINHETGISKDWKGVDLVPSPAYRHWNAAKWMIFCDCIHLVAPPMPYMSAIICFHIKKPF